jgi:hypothetical protein
MEIRFNNSFEGRKRSSTNIDKMIRMLFMDRAFQTKIALKSLTEKFDSLDSKRIRPKMEPNAIRVKSPSIHSSESKSTSSEMLVNIQRNPFHPVHIKHLTVLIKFSTSESLKPNRDVCFASTLIMIRINPTGEYA